MYDCYPLIYIHLFSLPAFSCWGRGSWYLIPELLEIGRYLLGCIRHCYQKYTSWVFDVLYLFKLFFIYLQGVLIDIIINKINTTACCVIKQQGILYNHHKPITKSEHLSGEAMRADLLRPKRLHSVRKSAWTLFYFCTFSSPFVMGLKANRDRKGMAADVGISNGEENRSKCLHLHVFTCVSVLDSAACLYHTSPRPD